MVVPPPELPARAIGYEEDFHPRSLEQVALLRAGRLSELVSRLEVLLPHLP